MRSLTVALDARSYPIHIGSGLLSRADIILEHLEAPLAAIVSNETVAPLYLEALTSALRDLGVRVTEIVLPDGESHKDWQTLNLIYNALLDNRCERATTIIALGGGVIGDLAGFAAATYQRGIPYIQVPTTLLAQVDSSVGGKTGINHPLGKNMIGAFYQPRLVLADTHTLKTLPDRELRAGLSEIIKYGLIRDLSFFEWLETNLEKLLTRDTDALVYAIERSCASKAAVVAEDERESGVRALLNLGHTFGHAIEAGLGFGRWLHGEAVAAGTMMAADLSCRHGWLSEEEFARILALLQRAGLPTQGPALGADRYLDLMAMDKKVTAGKIRLVLLKKIGEGVISTEASEDEILAAIEACCRG
ncbi:MAG: 3-dehydroquinate synthase [Rhodocyclaceae bacterium]|nr:3-dehydroquinate synthase [Rhodocyclaceae bacterium]